MKGKRIISGGTSSCTFPNRQNQSALLQQQWAKMQEVFKAEFIFRAGYFEYIKIDERTNHQRKLQRQPAPMRKIGFQTNIPAQYSTQPQYHGEQC